MIIVLLVGLRVPVTLPLRVDDWAIRRWRGSCVPRDDHIKIGDCLPCVHAGYQLWSVVVVVFGSKWSTSSLPAAAWMVMASIAIVIAIAIERVDILRDRRRSIRSHRHYSTTRIGPLSHPPHLKSTDDDDCCCSSCYRKMAALPRGGVEEEEKE